MAGRELLIARKHEIRGRINRLQRELAQLQTVDSPNQRRIRSLQEQVERLMAQESSLRMQIDRTR